MNILIKLMSIVSLVIAPTLAHNFHDRIIKDRHDKIEILNNMESSAMEMKENKNLFDLAVQPADNTKLLLKENSDVTNVIQNNNNAIIPVYSLIAINKKSLGDLKLSEKINQ